MDIIRYRMEGLRYQYNFQTFSWTHAFQEINSTSDFLCYTFFLYNKLSSTLSPGSFLKKLALIVLKIS